MLVWHDRGFDTDGFLREVAATGAQLPVRIRHIRRPPVLAQLSTSFDATGAFFLA